MKRLWIIVLGILIVFCFQRAWAGGAVGQVTITEVSVGPVVTVSASVLDEDRAHMAGLDASAFEVYEDNVLVSATAAEERAGLAVMVLVDLSGSMQEPGATEGQTRMDSLKEVAIQFIEQHLAIEDWVGVMGFHVETAVFQELTQDHGLARNRIYEMAFAPGKNTALLNTAGQALDALHDAPMGRMRKALLIFSDGKDYLEKEDPVRYREFREAVARKGRDYGIPIFVVGVGSHCGNNQGCIRLYPENEYNFEDVDWLADQTGGGSYHYSMEEQRSELYTLFDRLASQSMQYRINFDTHASKGDHHLRIRVTAGGGQAEDEQSLASPFEFPHLKLEGATPGSELDIDGGDVEWQVVPSFADGLPRELEVVFYVNDQAVYTDTDEPYSFAWQIDTYDRMEEMVIRATARDTILNRVEATLPVAVTLMPSMMQRFLNWLLDHSVALAVGLLSLALFVVLIRKRQVVVQAVSQTYAKATQLLGTQRSLARLKVVQGEHPGRVYKLTSNNNLIGRENCELIVEEGLTIHRQHACIAQQGTHWTITDLGKANGTWLDNMRLNPNSPAYLRSGSRVRLGDVEFEFIIVGGTTQILPTIP